MPTMKFTGLFSAEHTARLQPPDRVIEIRIAAEEILAAGRQREREWQSPRRCNGRGDPFCGVLQVIELRAAVILDRSADQAGRSRQTNGFGNALWRIRKAVLQVRRDGQVRRFDDDATMCKRLVARDLSIQASIRAGRRTTRSGKSFKAQALEDARRAPVPGIRKDERARRLVQRPEFLRFCLLIRHDSTPSVAATG
jgi:hypothetical protein